MSILIVDDSSRWKLDHQLVTLADKINSQYQPYQPGSFLRNIKSISGEYSVLIVSHNLGAGLEVVSHIPLQDHPRVVIAFRDEPGYKLLDQYRAAQVQRFKYYREVFDLLKRVQVMTNAEKYIKEILLR